VFLVLLPQSPLLRRLLPLQLLLPHPRLPLLLALK
jgi:hypothetical protein